MKTKFLSAAFLLLGISMSNAQTNLANLTITSSGLEAGTQDSLATFFGYGAGKNNASTGNYNAFFGHHAGTTNTTGGNNTFIGFLQEHLILRLL